MKKKVVILGGGPASLSAAYYLLKNSNKYDVTIIEQSNVVGGISKSITFDGNRIDTGIHRFFTKNDEVMNFWKEILPIQNKPTYEEKILNKTREYDTFGANPEEEDKCFLIKDRVTRIYYGRKFYDYPVTLNMNTITNMGFVNIIKAGFSYIKSCIIKRKENSLEDFYINRFGKVLYSMFFESYTEKVWGVHPSKISPDWGAQRVKGLSISAIIKDIFMKLFKLKNQNNTETSLIEKFYYPKLGSGQMYEEIANKIIEMGGNIKLSSEVISLEKNKNNVSKVIYKENNNIKEINCDTCISSISIKDIINFMNNVPKDIKDISNDLPYREFMSVGLIVDKIDLVNNTKIKTINDIVPDSWIYVQEPDVKMGRIQIFNNWSSYLFKNKEDINNKVMISLEYFCNENDEYWNMSDEDFINFAIEEAKKINIINTDNIESKVRIKIKKAYPAYFGSYNKINDVIEYLNSISNLYCIGRNGQHRYNNMDHSILTGIYAARSIIEESVNKSNIWNVNTEKEYHEEKTN